MIFLGYHTPLQQVILQDAKILKDTQLKSLLETIEDIMGFFSSNIAYANLREMVIETDPTLPPITSKPYATSEVSRVG